VKYSIVTFGCRVNQADSLVIEDQLRRRGMVDASPDQADLVVVNTCSVTASADQGARQTIRRIVRGNPSAKVIVTGCYATRRPDEVNELPNVVRVVPNSEKEALVESIEGGGDGPCGKPLEPGVAGRTALTLRVQTGCDEECSYCIIPRTRGAGRSRPLADVLRELRYATAAGYREIGITGVHLGSYGRDLDDGTTLLTLVRALAEWNDDVRFRISSLEPMDCTDEIIDCAATSSRIAPHFHLPLQHGSDDILAAMKRPYTSAYYRDVVEEIRRRVPDAAIGTDLIVGFPGETGDHFAEMTAFVERLPLTSVHVFPYSNRPGTAASRLRNKVGGDAIRARSRTLRDIAQKKAMAFRQSQAGRRVIALALDDGWSAVTGNYLKVRLEEQRLRNTWVEVTL
jgi:threonylcarbamoyladenosine tRNA methylthiotransferase MtaB